MSSSNESIDLERVYGMLGYVFRSPELLVKALTHSSYCYEHGMKYTENNERLEFLGDAVLDAVIAEELFERLRESEEGDLSRLRSEIVCETSLLRKSAEIGLNDHLRMGNGEANHAADGRKRALYADAMEAVLGAIFLDGGWEQVKSVILRLFENLIDDAIDGKLISDYKSALQEKLQADGNCNIRYVTELEEGPPHDRRFTVSVSNNGTVMARGSGYSKKSAEQDAARNALSNMKLS